MILDTSALIALAGGNDSVVASLATVVRPAIPVIALGEFSAVAAAMPHRRRHERWLRELMAVSDVLPIDATTAIHYARLQRQARDAVMSTVLWVAALGKQHKLPILSSDPDFDLLDGVRRIKFLPTEGFPFARGRRSRPREDRPDE